MRYTVVLVLVLELLWTWPTRADAAWPFRSRPACSHLATKAERLRDSEIAPSGAKSPGLAFLLSLAVPGLGELYSGAPRRAAGFMAVEAFTWIGYFHWRSKGNRLKADFRRFADQHWDEARYRAWQDFNASQGFPYTETETLRAKSEDAQQYYEMIGKYAQFVYGWDDVAAEFSTDLGVMRGLSQRRFSYEVQRNESNKPLKRASVVIGLAVFNRIVSAIHASMLTRSLQERAPHKRLWIDVTALDAYGRPTPAASVNVRF